MGLRRWVLTGCAVAALTVAGCSNVTSGTPMADPDQTGLTTTSARPTVPSTAPATTTRARPPDPTGPPTGLAATTCRDYLAMDEVAQGDVIAEIGKQNELIALNPELWITMASAMCTFAEPSTLVTDAVMGGGFN